MTFRWKRIVLTQLYKIMKNSLPPQTSWSLAWKNLSEKERFHLLKISGRTKRSVGSPSYTDVSRMCEIYDEKFPKVINHQLQPIFVKFGTGEKFFKLAKGEITLEQATA